MKKEENLRIYEVYDYYLLLTAKVLLKKIREGKQFSNSDYSVLKIVLQDYCKLFEVEDNEHKKL